jgi:hypothetical protein
MMLIIERRPSLFLIKSLERSKVMKCQKCGREYPKRFEGQKCTSKIVTTKNMNVECLIYGLGVPGFVPMLEQIICDGNISENQKRGIVETA